MIFLILKKIIVTASRISIVHKIQKLAAWCSNEISVPLTRNLDACGHVGIGPTICFHGRITRAYPTTARNKKKRNK